LFCATVGSPERAIAGGRERDGRDSFSQRLPGSALNHLATSLALVKGDQVLEVSGRAVRSIWDPIPCSLHGRASRRAAAPQDIVLAFKLLNAGGI
jgi:hypothetical protein